MPLYTVSSMLNKNFIKFRKMRKNTFNMTKCVTASQAVSKSVRMLCSQNKK